MKLLVLFTWLFSLCGVESLKILIVYPLAVKSLTIMGHSAAKHLLDAGHEVTYITVFPLKNQTNKNFRQIDISNNTILVTNDEKLSIAYVLEHKIEQNDYRHMQNFAMDNVRSTLQNENVKKLLADPNERFDAVIVDLFETEVYAGLAVLYDCPMIWMYSMGAHWHVQRLIHEATNPAYETDYLSLNMAPLSFKERVAELWHRIRWQVYKTLVILPEERVIYNQTFGSLLAKRGRALPDYEEVIFNASLIFGNEHNAVKNRPSTPQNFKYIGGFHIEDPVKPLPKDLQDLMDNAKHGVIYFSLGSFFKAKDLPRRLTVGLMKMFGELKQTVIWKFEEDLPDVSKNVRIVHWAPQPSILVHPNLKIFITHGGFLSSIETIHFGVPTIGVPISFDQFANVKKSVDHKYALKVTLNFDLPKNLKSAIEVMLNDNRYADSAKKLSSIYHDRIANPGAELVHWVQHVVRTRGALHLRSPALHVPLYQRLYLDLLGVILGALSAIYFIVNSMFRKSHKVSEKKKN